MKDIALAGFVLTAEEWEALDPVSRAQLVAAVDPKTEWIAAPVLAEPSERVDIAK